MFNSASDFPLFGVSGWLDKIIFWVILLFVVLGIWKFVELAIYVFYHFHIAITKV